MSKQLDKGLLELAPTTQLPVTVSSTVAPPPYNAEGGSTETWPMLALNNNSNILMGDINNKATNELLANKFLRIVGLSLEGGGV